MKDNGMKYISDAFRAVEIMRTNVGMPMDRLFAVVLPHSAKEVMEEPHIRLLNQSYISVLSDIGRIRPQDGFRYRICGMEFYGLFIHPEATLSQHELEYLLTRLRYARVGTVFLGDHHQEIALNILIGRAEETGLHSVNELSQRCADMCGIGDKYKEIVTDMMWEREY